MGSKKTGRVALVTGANRGIGLETARQLSQRSWQVVIAVRDSDSGRQTAESLRTEGSELTVLPLDVSSSESIAKAAMQFSSIADHLDVLINNAGIYPDEDLTILTVPRHRMDQTLQTNTLGPLEVTQAFLSYLRKGTSARVVNVSSGYGQLEGLSAGVPSYCLSKLALNGVTIMLAEALRGDGIAVNAMCPGWVRTDMGGPNASRSIPEGADTAVWLAAEAPQKLTGKLFRDRREISW